MPSTDPVAANVSFPRWSLVRLWVLGLLLYSGLILISDAAQAIWINDIAWTIASALAAWACFRAARSSIVRNGIGWNLVGVGCATWFVGQLIWNYRQLVQGEPWPARDISQAFFTAFSVFIIAGALRLPERQAPPHWTFRNVANVGLVGSCLAFTVLIGVFEPAINSQISGLYFLVGATHTTLVSISFLVCLYCLWSFRWNVGWGSMLLLVIGMAVHAVSNFVYARALLTDTYMPGDLINMSWLVVFGLIAAAAHEQRWSARNPNNFLRRRLQERERWLEAVIPALLITIMVAVAITVEITWSSRVVASAAVLLLVFAWILGAREAWIQRESQMLNDQLMLTNEQLQIANAELRVSELRERELNAALEQRVAERTAQLKSAYEELEGFSYAVAHDLKAPLRAINSFAHLLHAENSGQLDERAKDHLNRIRNGALKMAALIDGLLSYAKMERRSLYTSVIDIRELVDGVLSEFADEIQARNVEIVRNIEPLRLRVDEEGVALALRNIIDNALKYTRDSAHPRVEISVRLDAEHVVLRVADNGIGFDMQYRDHIFRVFHRLHRDDQYPGTGIGLALVRKAIERMGGRIAVDSTPGEGAQFSIELPRKGVLER